MSTLLDAYIAALKAVETLTMALEEAYPVGGEIVWLNGNFLEHGTVVSHDKANVEVYSALRNKNVLVEIKHIWLSDSKYTLEMGVVEKKSERIFAEKLKV